MGVALDECSPMSELRHEHWMQQAIDQAKLAGQASEVPVGAVVVFNDEVVGRGYNQPIVTHDPSAHAEVMALRQACLSAKNYRLPGARLYVTVEPCMMCLGSLIHARVDMLVYGAAEPKAGAVHSHPLVDSVWLNHHPRVVGGILQDQCSALMTEFFSTRRVFVKKT